MAVRAWRLWVQARVEEPQDAVQGGPGRMASLIDQVDGQHRVRAFSLRDAQGSVVPGSFLIGGEEAKNGDYQDYVFVLTNVEPSP